MLLVLLLLVLLLHRGEEARLAALSGDKDNAALDHLPACPQSCLRSCLPEGSSLLDTHTQEVQELEHSILACAVRC